ncbi:MAG TPA: RagB/SusD family nutrient uptake outer membrane protein [Longimicrobiaceae bacterium]|nr:RagB/SusD family nutrient uptake outer membrane protein [Longimicrobiaceae bacterium]
MRALMLHAARSALGRARSLALLLACGLAVVGCESLLDVEKPGVIPAEDLNDPVRAPLLVAGAIGDFECAFGAFVVMGGIIREEFIDATQTADRWPYDRREVSPGDQRYSTTGCANLGVYVPLSTARFTADDVLAKLEVWTDAEMPEGVNRTRLIATAAAYAGYSSLLIGEAFCSAAVDLGPEMTPREFFERAEARFTRAIEAATAVGGAAADSIRHMSRVGRARARLNLSQFVPAKLAEAAADAALVPVGFVRNATASAAPARRENRVFSQNNQAQSVSVGTQYRNLLVEGVPDQRVRVTDANRTATDGTRIWVQEKYAGLGSPLPIATYDEAQLILAEAALRGGNPAGAVTIINALRARSSTPAYTGGTSAAEVMALLIDERRRELFLEGHHLYDSIRFNLSLQPATGTVFSKGGTYGSTKCMPLPDIERLNNPNIG